MRRTTWAIWITFAAIAVGSTAKAQAPDPRRDQVAAATARAVDRLRAQIAREPVARNITVGDILKSTGGTDALVKTLQRAQMIGGPRWLDDQTCQVRLEITGPRVAGALGQIVAANPKKSPIAPEVLAARLKEWENRTFAATSTSTGGDIVEQVRPANESAVWAPISDEARQQAIAAAKRNAGGQVTRAISPIELADGKTVGDALADPNVRGAIDQWFASRPVTQVEFRDDLQVAVTLATPAAELADVIVQATGLPQSEHARARQAIQERVPASSRGSARAGLVNMHRAAVAQPVAPPAWVKDQLDADGAGSSKGSRLMAARAAETDAQIKLREKIESLPLTASQTLGAAAKQDPRLADIIARTVARARASKVDYQSENTASVRLSLQLADLWDAIASER